MMTEVKNASASMRLPIQPAMGSPMRLPNSRRNSAPNSGRAGTSQIRSRTSCAFIGPSALQHPHVVGGGAAPASEDRDDDREADGHFGGGDDQGEEHEHLAPHIVELTGESHEREVHRVEHQLDAHEHDQHVAAHEDTDRAY